MTQKGKQLLLKDLCARLPYGVKLGFENSNVVLTPKDYCCFTRQLFTNMIFPEHDGTVEYGCQFYEYRPYLRPMSSMTEEEEKIFNDFLEFQAEYVSDADLYNKTDMYDWLLANQFDYRIVPSTGKSMIESGLALEAPEGMYKTE